MKIPILILVTASVVASAQATITGTQIYGPGPSFQAFVNSWEDLDEAAWKQLVSPTISFDITPAPPIPVNASQTGPDAVWSFREALPKGTNAPLAWTNTYSNFMLHPDRNAVTARMTTFMRNDGSLIQIGDWEMRFAAQSGLIEYMHQDVIWAAWIKDA